MNKSAHTKLMRAWYLVYVLRTRRQTVFDSSKRHEYVCFVYEFPF